MVREGKERTSKEASSRLATGAMVKQVALEGERLHYEQLSGSGPDKGWVSTKLNGKELLVHGYNPEVGGAGEGGDSDIAPPELSPEDKAEMAQPYEAWMEEYRPRLAKFEKGEVPAAPGPPERPADDVPDVAFEELRKRAIANQKEDKFGAADFVYPPWVLLKKADMEKKAKEMKNGDLYGLPVPPTLSHVQKLGTSWLTSAFHTAGTLPKDNAVKSMKMKRLKTTTKDAAGGAGPKAFLSVEYEKEDPELHKELFVKMPWATEGSKEMGGDMGWRYTTSSAGDMEFQECVVYRFVGPVLPVKIPKYYFADCCRENTNYILITEKVNYGDRDREMSSFKPYEILPSPQKYWDFMLPKQHQVDMYCTLVRAQARMAAWYQNGFFSAVPPVCIGETMRPPAPGSFPFPFQLPAGKREGKKKAGKAMAALLKELLTLGEHVFPAGLTDPAFMEAMSNFIEDGFAYLDDVKGYSCLWPEQVGLTHSNLNCDNAFYWRDADGKLDCGLIDFGGLCPMNVAQGFSGGFTGAEGWMQDEWDVAVLKVFKDEYYRECGIRLNLKELERGYHFAYMNYVIYMTMNIEQEIFAQLPRKEWKNIKDLHEPRMVDKWTLRTYSDMTRNTCTYCYRRWIKGGRKNIHIHDTLLEWKKYWEANGME
mmetsp:Transcript_113697/g.196458  ORF Transcript_113697/g.196458 Transcript_113697/m.196458 type:complete len:652 (-) Transcript_113697:145-2100(-)